MSASGLLRVNSNFLKLDSNSNKLLLLVIVRHLNRSADFIYHNDETAEEEGGDGGEDVGMMKYKVNHSLIIVVY